jgi:hypothetical protein
LRQSLPGILGPAAGLETPIVVMDERGEEIPNRYPPDGLHLDGRRMVCGLVTYYQIS